MCKPFLCVDEHFELNVHSIKFLTPFLSPIFIFKSHSSQGVSMDRNVTNIISLIYYFPVLPIFFKDLDFNSKF